MNKYNFIWIDDGHICICACVGVLNDIFQNNYGFNVNQFLKAHLKIYCTLR